MKFDGKRVYTPSACFDITEVAALSLAAQNVPVPTSLAAPEGKQQTRTVFAVQITFRGGTSFGLACEDEKDMLGTYARLTDWWSGRVTAVDSYAPAPGQDETETDPGPVLTMAD
jgi:hypothetical protein